MERRSYSFGVDAAAFTERVGELEKVLEKTLCERDEYRKLYELLSEEVERLRRGLLGSKAERVDAAQTQLAFDAVRDLILSAVLRAEQANDPTAGSECVPADETPTASGSQPSAQPGGAPGSGTTPPNKAKGAHGRTKNPEHLPIERIEIVPPEVRANPELFEKIGEEASETLERRSAMTVRVLTVRSKYVLRSSRSSRPVADVDAPCSPQDAQALQCAGQRGCEDGCCPTFPEALEDLGSTCHAESTESVGPRGATTTVLETAGTHAAAIFISELPGRALARCRAGPNLLAYVLVSKYADHIPWNRMEKIFAREHLELARSTLCDWSMASAEVLKPIVTAMHHDAKRHAFCICIDATGVMVQQKERCRWGHFWVMVADRDHVLFCYSRTHDHTVPLKLLSGFEGYLQADASSVYEALYGQGDAIEVACWAHARRYFHKALPSDRERAMTGIGLINKLFAIDREIADLPPSRRLEERRRRSTPVVDAFEAWTDIENLTILPKSPIAAALTYAFNQRAALRRFLDDGRLRLDNNLSELELRRQAVGRKNWLFVATDDGGEANATIVSLVASCELHDLDPQAYLRDVLTVIPGYPEGAMLDLAPKNWRATRDRLVRQGHLPDASAAAIAVAS